MANSDPYPWVELLVEFPCLWDPRDRGFDDENQRVQAYEQLLEQCKQRASHINMVTLKLWVASFHRYKTGRKTMGVCTECIAKSKDLAQLLPEFPCLWDFRDLNFSDNTVKDHCVKQLLEKYNDSSIQKIDMETLLTKLNVFNQNRIECSRAKTCRVMLTRERLNPDVALSNQQELVDTRVQTVGPAVLPSSEQLLETYADTSYPIHKELDGEPMQGHQYREASSQDSTELLAELLKDYPILWDPQDLNYLDNYLKASAREHLFERYNAICSVPMDMAGLKRKLKSLRRSMTSKGTQKSAERMAEMIEEFPCLYDHRNTDWEERKRARVQLLAKYNAVSSIPINMNKLIQKINSYIRRRNKLSKRSDQATTRLQRSEDSQCSQTNSHSTEASINEPQPSDEFQHIDYEMDSDDEYNSDNDCKDIKDDPILITDTEFVKQSVNMCVKETEEGKRVFVYLNGCLSLAHDRKNDNEIESVRTDLATDSDNVTDNKNAKIDSGIDIVDLSSSSEDDDGIDNTINIIYDSLRETELDVATKDDIPKENGKSAVYVTHSEDTEELDSGIERDSDTKCMGTFSETIEENELLYSVVLPNIFRRNSE